MTDLLLEYFELLIYNASIIIMGVIAGRHLIHYWHISKAIGQAYIDTEMMKRQLEFQKELMALNTPTPPESAVQ